MCYVHLVTLHTDGLLIVREWGFIRLGGGSISKIVQCKAPHEILGCVAFCTILISELSRHACVTFCATFGIFPHVLSLEITYALSYL